MVNKLVLQLGSADRSRLQQIFVLAENRQERERAQSLILLDDGLSLALAANKFGIHVRTVGFTRLDWLARRFESLVDKQRSGAPQKISPAQLSKVLDAARSEPLTDKALLAKRVDDGGTLVHLSTLKDSLKAAGFVWKRMRHSLKKRNETDFRQAQVEIELLREQAQAGDMVLAYVDEARFAHLRWPLPLAISVLAFTAAVTMAHPQPLNPIQRPQAPGSGSSTPRAATSYSATSPAQPLSSNDPAAALLGPDLNGDGIRDDLEPIILTRYRHNPKMLTAARQQLRAMQRSLVATGSVDQSFEAVLVLNRSIDCVLQVMGLAAGATEVAFLRDVTLNSRQRVLAWILGNDLLAGKFAPGSGPAPCDG